MNKKFPFLLITMLVICFTTMHAQNIAINDNGASPDTTAILDVSSTTKGFLIPRMTTAQRNLIASPAQGLLVYCITDSSFYYYSNGWSRLSKSNEAWGLKGNAGTNANTDFIGTTDGAPLHFKVANDNAGLLNTSQNNTAFGRFSLDSVTDAGVQNTAIGANSLKNNRDGFYNAALGSAAGFGNKNGSGNTFIGAYADALSPSLLGSSAIGFNSKVDQDYSLVLGQPGTRVGIGISKPVSLFCNTDSNITGASTYGINSQSFTWNTQQQGFAAALHNKNMSPGSNGLAVKIANSTVTGTLLDLSTGSSATAPGQSVMIVRGNGNVGINNGTPVQKLDINGKAVISDSVGIGITTPTAQLHLSNTLQNRKIVLWDLTGSNHEYFGFGVNSGIFRYQVPSAGNDHIFYAGSSATSSTELIRIRGNGKLGVGQSNPYTKFSNIDSNILAADGVGMAGLSMSWAMSTQGYVQGICNSQTGFGRNGLAVKIAGTASNNTILDLSTGAFLTGAANSVMIVRGNGNVGINKASPQQKLDVAGNVTVRDSLGIGLIVPHAPLQFGNLQQNRKIVLWETANDDNQFYGLGINAGVLRYQTPTVSSDHVFYAGTSAMGSNELMRIKGDGNIGIKVSNPVSLLSNTNLNIAASDNIGVNTNSLTWTMNDVGYTQALYNSSASPGSNGLSVKIASTNSFSSILDLSTGAVQNGAGTSVLVVKGDGNVGIGTSTTNEKLIVNGAVKIADGGYAGLTNNAAIPVPAGGAGTMVFSNGHFFGWNGTVWKQLDN